MRTGLIGIVAGIVCGWMLSGSALAQPATRPAPAGTIELAPNMIWTDTSRGGEFRSDRANLIVKGTIPSFQVFDAARVHSWMRAFNLPISGAEHPICVMKYRATNVDPKVGVLWLLRRGAANSAEVPIPVEVIADGQPHESRVDLRRIPDIASQSAATWTRMTISIGSADTAPAVFELLGLRFEPAPEAAPEAVAAKDDQPVKVSVTGKDGKPIAGATVIIDAERVNIARSATTDAQGIAQVTPLLNEAGKHMLRVEKQGMSPAEIPDVSTAIEAESVAVKLFPLATFGGTVRDEQGKPVANARVNVVAYGEGVPPSQLIQTSAVAMTDGEGKFQAALADTGRVSIQARHPDYVYEPLPRNQPGIVQQLTDGSAVIVLKQGLRLGGRLIGPDGRPVANAIVKRDSNSSNTSAVTRTDADGKFVFAATRSGSVPLLAQAAGFAPQMITVSVSADRDDIEMKLQPGVKLAGQVHGPGDKPIADAHVTVTGWRGIRSQFWTGTTDSQGHFAWTDSPAEEVVLNIQAKDYLDIRDLRLIPGTEGPTIRMSPAVTIAGVVRDASTAKPIERFTVTQGILPNGGGSSDIVWQSTTSTAAADGRYESTFSFPYPAYAVRIQAEGYKPAISRTFNSDQGSGTYDFKLAPVSYMSGIVRQPDGTPAAGARIMVATLNEPTYLLSGGASQRNSIEYKADAAGKYRVPAEDPPFALVVQHAGGFAQVSSDAIAKSPDVTLQRWGRIEGTVMKGRQPAASQRILLSSNDVMVEPQTPSVLLQLEATSDDKGKFNFDQVPAGNFTIARSETTDMGDGRLRMSRIGDTEVSVKSGEISSVQLGGTGRSIVGKLSAPAGLNPDFTNAQVMLRPGAGEIKIPTELQAKVDAFREKCRNADLPLQEKIVWMREWQKSSEGIEIERVVSEQEMRSYSSVRQTTIVVSKDGSFRGDEVPAGDYTLQAYLIERVSNDSSAITAIATEPIKVPAGDIETPVDLGSIVLTDQRSPTDATATRAAPTAFEAKTFDGQVVKLESYQGKYVLLSFWASWNLSCEPMIERLKQIQEEFGTDGRLVQLSLNLDESPENALAAIKSLNMKWTQLTLGGKPISTVPAMYGAASASNVVLIGPDGNIVAQSLSGGRIRQAVSQALSDTKGR